MHTSQEIVLFVLINRKIYRFDFCVGKQQTSTKSFKKNQDEHVRLNVRKTLKEVLTARCKESQTAINLEVCLNCAAEKPS